MSVNFVDNSYQNTIAAIYDRTKLNINSQDFLLLLKTQITNQDPFNPLETDKVIEKLNLQSNFEEQKITNMHLENLQNILSKEDKSTIANYLGKNVVADLNSIEIENGEVKVEGSYFLDDPSKVSIKIYDNNKNLLKTIGYESKDEGYNTIQWDMADEYGNKIGDGTYNYEIDLMDENGNIEKLDSKIQGLVNSVYYYNNSNYLALEVDDSDSEIFVNSKNIKEVKTAENNQTKNLKFALDKKN